MTTCTNVTISCPNNANSTKNNTDDSEDTNIEGFNLADFDLTFGVFETLPGLKKLLTFSGPLNFT